MGAMGVRVGHGLSVVVIDGDMQMNVIPLPFFAPPLPLWVVCSCFSLVIATRKPKTLASRAVQHALSCLCWHSLPLLPALPQTPTSSPLYQTNPKAKKPSSIAPLFRKTCMRVFLLIYMSLAHRLRVSRLRASCINK
jgi:hypothetical protein